jgi:muconolactone D-isomerase
MSAEPARYDHLNPARLKPIRQVSMEFLVHITITLPPGLPDSERQALYAAEAARAAYLASAGQLVRLWRVPGRTANWGLWRTSNATELHDALTSLPLWPYMHIEVTALAEHPNDPAGHLPGDPAVGR